MNADETVDILILVAKASHEDGLVKALKNEFGKIRALTGPSIGLLQQVLGECTPKLVICDLDSQPFSIRDLNKVIKSLKLNTRIIAAAPAASIRAVIRAMAQGARDLVSPEDPLHLQLVAARELDMLADWCERNAQRLAPFVDENDGHAVLDGFRIVSCDEVFSRLIGSPAKGLASTSLLQHVDGDDHQVVKKLINSCIQGDQDAEPVAASILRSDGSRKKMLLSIEASYKDDSVSLMLTAQSPAGEAEAESPAPAAATPSTKAPIAAKAASAEAVDPAISKRVLNALKQNQMSLVVQPISELVGQSTRKPISKLDIYVMLKDAEGELPASKFIREARASGLIRYVDRWVIQNACKVLRSNLEKEGPMLLFLRLSRQSLHDPTLVAAIRHEIREQNIPPYCLSFEIIQPDINDLTEDEIKVMHEIKRAGFQLTLCGLGADPVLQRLLQRLSVDFIKLDPKLTEKAQHSEKVQKLIRGFVESANAANIGVIATHVPDATSMAALWNLGVHYVQGNYLHEPEVIVQA